LCIFEPQYFMESQSREVVQADWRLPEEIAEHFGFVKKHNDNLIPTRKAFKNCQSNQSW